MATVPALFVPRPIGWGPNELGSKWCIFLTNWSMVVLGLYLWWAALCALNVVASTASHHLLWLLRNSITPAAGIVTLVYWTILYPTIGHTSLVDVHCHAVNTLLLLVDMTISRLPYYLQHFHHSLGYLVTYLLFSVIYYAIGATDPWGHHYIYGPLDYGGNPIGALVLILVLIAVVFPLLQLGFWRWWWLWERKWGGDDDNQLVLDKEDGLGEDGVAPCSLQEPLIQNGSSSTIEV